ncbi:MAG: hypothetical protein EXX96DRAFT_592980 [Benjaminiella poitrasii]|nr:MAG: hypothetical protein EXX96DRAFT_592980 [Benjaminiella poitrasii]
MYGGSLPGTPGSVMSVGSSLAPSDRILTVKCSIDSIHWNPEFRQQLDQFINNVNKVTTHAYSFSKYIFLRTFIEYKSFDISQYINRDFFGEVWLSLTLYVRGSRISARTLERREFIERYLPDYCRIANYQRIPFSYVTINSKILCQNILGLVWTSFTGDKLTLWERVVDLNSAPFRYQEDGVLRFRGTIQTDGVGVRYISDLSQEEHQLLVGRCVTVDPGRRDLLYFFQKRKKYRNILQDIKPQNISEAERSLLNVRSLVLQEFEHFLESRSLAYGNLFNFYLQTSTRHNTAHPLHRKLRLSSYIKKQQDEQDFIRKLKNHFDPDAVFVIEFGIHAVTSEKQILLSCINQTCREAMHTRGFGYRLWNRDLAACLNMLHIIRSLREDGVVPARFSRSNVPRRRRRRRQQVEGQRRIRPRIQ